MKMTILGSGNVGSALGVSWARTGHEVTFEVREPSSPDVRSQLTRCGVSARATLGGQPGGAADLVVTDLPWEVAYELLPTLNLAEDIAGLYQSASRIGFRVLLRS